MMAALGTAIMLVGGVVPVMTYISPLLAGVFIIPVRVELGRKWGWMVWGTVSILSIVLCADKEAGFFYVFAGYYPLIKEYIDRIKGKVISILAKAGIFTASMGMMYLFLIYVIALPSVIADFSGVSLVVNILIFAVMILILICFDRMAAIAAWFYAARIRPKMKSIRRRG